MKRVGQVYREALLKRFRDGVEKKSSVFLLSYSKLSSPKISELRKNLNKVGADVFVSKNSIAALALKEMNHQKLAERISGQTAIIYSDADSSAISKILINFAKDLESVSFKGGLLDGHILEADDVKKLSDLPSREVLLSQLLGVLEAPVSRLLGAMNAKSQELLSILKQLSEKKGGN